MSYFACAAVAGAVASLVTDPLDNVKTKLQTQNQTSTCEKIDALQKELNKTKLKNENNVNLKNMGFNMFSTRFRPDCNSEPKVKYTSILSTMKYIYKEDGFFRGFFKGLTPRVITNAPSCAISWGTYEVIKSFLSVKVDR